MSVVTEADATPNGIWIYEGDFSFEVDGLEGGKKYRLKVFAGVYENRGALSVTVSVGGKEYTFSDSTVYNGGASTSNVVYDVVIDLTAMSGQTAQVSVSWAYVKGKGNVTLQALALALLKQS